MEIWMICAVLSCIPAYVADSKGYNWKLWFLAAWALNFFTLIPVTAIVLLLRKKGNR